MITIGIMYQPHEQSDMLSSVRELSDYKLALLPIETGSNQAENRAELIGMVNTEFFTWLDPDDWIDPKFIPVAVDRLSSNPRAAMMRGIEQTVYPDGFTEVSRRLPTYNEIKRSPKAYHNGVVFRTAMLKKALAYLMPAGRFYSIDHALRLILASHYTFGQVDEVGYYWRQHSYQHHKVSHNKTGDLIPNTKIAAWLEARGLIT